MTISLWKYDQLRPGGRETKGKALALALALALKEQLGWLGR